MSNSELNAKEESWEDEKHSSGSKIISAQKGLENIELRSAGKSSGKQSNQSHKSSKRSKSAVSKTYNTLQEEVRLAKEISTVLNQAWYITKRQLRKITHIPPLDEQLLRRLAEKDTQNLTEQKARNVNWAKLLVSQLEQHKKHTQANYIKNSNLQKTYALVEDETAQKEYIRCKKHQPRPQRLIKNGVVGLAQVVQLQKLGSYLQQNIINGTDDWRLPYSLLALENVAQTSEYTKRGQLEGPLMFNHYLDRIFFFTDCVLAMISSNFTLTIDKGDLMTAEMRMILHNDHLFKFYFTYGGDAKATQQLNLSINSSHTQNLGQQIWGSFKNHLPGRFNFIQPIENKERFHTIARITNQSKLDEIFKDIREQTMYMLAYDMKDNSLVANEVEENMVGKNMNAETVLQKLGEMEMHKYLKVKAAFYQKMHQQVLYKQEIGY